MKFRLVVCILLFPLALALAGGMAGAQTVSNHDLAILFRNVVFFTDNGPGWTGKPLFRWAGPVTAYMAGGRDYRPNVVRLFKDFSRLTGLPFRLTGEARRANLRIFFLTRAEIRKRFKAPKMNCAGRLGGSLKKGKITRASVFIAIDARAKAEHCLAEELTQILGLTGDINLFKNSVFHEGSTQKKLSVIDRIMIKTLYDERLTNGMKLAQAMPIAGKVILEIMTNMGRRTRGKDK
jgi:hypothetical protein